MRVFGLGTAILFIAGACLSFSVSASAEDWRTMTMSQLPAHVASLTFAKDIALTPEEGIRKDAWEIRFGAEAPVATGATNPDGTLGVIEIKDFVCVNSVVGEKKCSMSMWLPMNDVKYRCFFWGDGTPRIVVSCPTDLKLK